MLTYLRGASASLAVASIVYYLFLVNISGVWLSNNSSTKDIFLLIMSAANYAFGVLGYILIRILNHYKITNTSIRLILFTVLGEAVALFFYITVPFDWKLHFITVVSSISFGLTTFIRNMLFSKTLTVIGPITAIFVSFLL